jgi:hypothetical protein
MAFVNQLARRGFSASARLAKIHEVVIVGGGLMGAGIAQVQCQYIRVTRLSLWEVALWGRALHR